MMMHQQILDILFSPPIHQDLCQPKLHQQLTFNPSSSTLLHGCQFSSDENLKKDISTIEDTLDKVKQLKGNDLQQTKW